MTFFRPVAQCAKCERGVVKSKNGRGYHLCECKECNDWWIKLQDVAMPREHMLKWNIENFNKDREPKAYAAVRNWLVQVKAGKNEWLILHGDNGTGKTHLATAATNYLVSVGVPAVVVSAAELYDHIETKMFSRNKDHKQLERDLEQCPVLIIDDLTARKLDERVAGMLFRIIDQRSMLSKPTFTTMDQSPSLVEKLPGWRRIMDRFYDRGTIVKMQSTSMRFENALERAKKSKSSEETPHE